MWPLIIFKRLAQLHTVYSNLSHQDQEAEGLKSTQWHMWNMFKVPSTDFTTTSQLIKCVSNLSSHLALYSCAGWYVYVYLCAKQWYFFLLCNIAYSLKETTVLVAFKCHQNVCIFFFKFHTENVNFHSLLCNLWQSDTALGGMQNMSVFNVPHNISKLKHTGPIYCSAIL